MMITPRIFRNSLLCLPLVVGSAGLVHGTEAAGAVAISAIVALANLALFAWIGTGLISRVATGQGGGLHGALFASKLFVTLPLYSLLFVVLGPLYTMQGFGAVFGGVALTGFQLAIEDLRAGWSPPEVQES